MKLRVKLAAISREAKGVVGLAVLLGFASSLSGCGNLIRDRSSDYVDAQNPPRLVVPPWYNSDKIQPRYPVPAITHHAELSRDYRLPAPPDVGINAQEIFYELEKVDDQVWLLVNELPERVWPAMRQYIANQGGVLVHQNPRVGLMQTGLLNNSAKARALLVLAGIDADAAATASVVMQIRIAQGIKRTTSEIQVRFLATQTPEAFESWPVQPPIPVAEEQLLNDVGQWLQNHREERAYSLLAQDIGGSARVSLVSADGDARLRLDLGFERAWNSAGRALKKAGIRVVDLDRSQGTYFAHYVDPDDKPGWLMSFFKSDVDEEALLSNDFNLLVKLEPVGDHVELRVEDAKDKSWSPEQRKAVVEVLLDHMN